ncbi:MAG: hypothetical protein AAFQ82_18095, partial [Myxococcota bacterium]
MLNRIAGVAFVLIAAGCGESATDSSPTQDSNLNSNTGDSNSNSNSGNSNGNGGNALARALDGLGSDFVRVGDEPVLNPRSLVAPISGEPSMFALGDPCAVWDSESQLWRVYWSYTDLLSEEAGGIATGIVGATSADGVNFTINPVLSVEPLGTFDTSSVETCDVIIVGEGNERTFYMFYSGAQAENSTDPEAAAKYKIALATSTDGVRFTPISASESPVGQEGVLFGNPKVSGAPDVFGNFITDPVAVYRDGTFHLWTLCIDQIPEPFGGICYHTSSDALQWTHHGVVSGLNRAFAIQPTVYFNPTLERFEMYVEMDTPEEEAQIH